MNKEFSIFFGIIVANPVFASNTGTPEGWFLIGFLIGALCSGIVYLTIGWFFLSFSKNSQNKAAHIIPPFLVFTGIVVFYLVSKSWLLVSALGSGSVLITFIYYAIINKKLN